MIFPSSVAATLVFFDNSGYIILFWGCLDDVMVKDVRRCSARRARRIRGFNPHRSQNFIVTGFSQYYHYQLQLFHLDVSNAYKQHTFKEENVRAV